LPTIVLPVTYTEGPKVKRRKTMVHKTKPVITREMSENLANLAIPFPIFLKKQLFLITLFELILNNFIKPRVNGRVMQRQTIEIISSRLAQGLDSSNSA